MAISFSVKIAASECGLSERMLHSAIKRGDLKVMRVGRRVLISPIALQEFLNQGASSEKVAND